MERNTCFASATLTKIARYSVATLAYVSATLTLTASTAVYAATGVENEEITVKVRVEAAREPAQAIGIVLSTEGARQIPKAVIQKVTDKLFDIIFAVERSELTDSSVATAMAISAGGDITFANVTPPLLSDARAIIANIPECPAVDPTMVATANQFGPWQQLVAVRKQRAELARDRIRLILDDEMLAKLRRFEEAFGLSQSDELSATLPAAELVDRLSRINYAVRQYQLFKKQNQPSQATK